MTGLPLRVGVVGCGNISDTYLRNAGLFVRTLRITACADLNAGLAQAKAAEWGLHAMTPDALLAAEDIDVVLNLTVPTAHVAVSSAALRAGKHVYSEKPLALTAAEADGLADLAARQGRLVAAAPDTILGAATQAALAAIRSGAIGDILGANAAIMDRGMEGWHPNPLFFFRPGGGPVMDMGPYYLASLIALAGPVIGVTTLASTGVTDRRVVRGPLAGTPIPVEVPTSVRALLRFASGADAVFQASWDIWQHGLPHLEMYGTDGTLSLPDPNWFGTAPRLSRQGGVPEPLDLSPFAFGTPNRDTSDGPVADYRGAGLADLCQAVLTGRLPRLGLSFARHVTAVLQAVADPGADLPPLPFVPPAPLDADDVATW